MNPGTASNNPKTPTKTTTNTTQSQSKPTPYNKGSASQALCNVLGRIADIEESFRADLDHHASDVPLEDFILFLLSCGTRQEDRAVLEEKLDRLMDISLQMCSGQTALKDREPAARRRPPTRANPAGGEEPEAELARDAGFTLRDDWRQHLQDYAKATYEEARYAPFVLLANSILQELQVKTHRDKLADIGLAADDESHPHIIFQRNDPRVISAEYNGVSGEALDKDVGRKPDLVVLSLSDALSTVATHSTERQAGAIETKWKERFKEHMIAAPKEPTHAPSFPEAKVCLEFKRAVKGDLSGFAIPPTYEKKKPSEIKPQTWEPARSTYASGSSTKFNGSRSITTHMSSSVQEYRNSSGKSKRPFVEDDEQGGDPRHSKKSKIVSERFSGLPGPIQSAIYAAGKLSASFATDHTLNVVVQDSVLYLWWYDRGGAVQSHGLDLFNDFPYFVALLAILDHFNEEDWGTHPAFENLQPPEKKRTAYNLTLSGQGLAGLDTVFRLKMESSKRNSAYSLFGRGTSVKPVTSSAPNPLQSETSLTNVKMIAKIYHPETARMDEGGLLKVAHSIAGSKLDPDGYVKGHLPLLLASRSWEDRYGRRMNAMFNSKNPGKLMRVSRCFRVMVFVKIYPIWELKGTEFVKAMWECICCHYGLARNGVLHRDISVDNLMYFRKLNGEIVGVLNDFDLAIVEGYSRNLSYEKTGTIPFMAHQLLQSMKTKIPRPHLYEYDFESFYYVTLWVTCSYDGSCLVNKGVFDDWLDAPNYGDVATAKRHLVKDLSEVELTVGHAETRSLLRLFAKGVQICFRDQDERENTEGAANETIKSWSRGDRMITKVDALAAEKELAELNTSLVWPQGIGRMDTLFAVIKVHFDQYLYVFSAAHQASVNANAEAKLAPQDTAARQGATPLGELEQLAVSGTMCSDEAVAHAGDASRAFWQTVLNQSIPEWHSLALFLKDNHSELFPSPPPLPPPSPSPSPPPKAPSPSS